MRKEYVLGLFIVLICVQIVVPVSMIVKRETTLKYGSTFRFKTAPVDPYDAFRGRYVALRVEINPVAKPEGKELKFGQKVFAELGVDDNGFAKIRRISTQIPKGAAYLAATVTRPIGSDIGISLPIDRYYMEERAAPRAEQVYREHSRSGKQDAYVVVKVMKGFSVVEGLFIGGERIESVLKRKG